MTKDLIRERLEVRRRQMTSAAHAKAGARIKREAEDLAREKAAREHYDNVQRGRSVARLWAEAHYRTEGPCGLFDPPTFRLTFKDHGPFGYCMTVMPVLYDTPVLRLTFVLTAVDGRLCWLGYNNPKKLFVEEG